MINLGYQVYDANESLRRVTQFLSESIESSEFFSRIPDDESIMHNHVVHASAAVLAVTLSFHTSQNSDEMIRGKIRSIFIQECIAICRDNGHLRGISICDDSLIAVFDSPFKADIQTIIDTAARVNTIRLFLQSQADCSCVVDSALCVHYGQITVMSLDQDSMLSKDNPKEGFNNPQHSFDFVWGGKAVKNIRKITECITSDMMNKVVITPIVYQNLDENYRSFFDKEVEIEDGVRMADIYNVKMKNLALQK